MVYRHEKEESKMKDFTIKDKCDKCEGTYDLDGVIYPNILQTGDLHIEQATLCAVCREGFDIFLKEKREEYENKSTNKKLSVM